MVLLVRCDPSWSYEATSISAAQQGVPRGAVAHCDDVTRGLPSMPMRRTVLPWARISRHGQLFPAEGKARDLGDAEGPLCVICGLLGTGFLLLVSLSSNSSCSRGIKGDMAKSTECSKSLFQMVGATEEVNDFGPIIRRYPFDVCCEERG
jgi:hypothetical protein